MMQTADAQTRPPRLDRLSARWSSVFVSALLLVVCMFVLYRRADWREIATILSRLDPLAFVAAIVLYWCQYPVNALRFQRIVVWSRPARSAVKLPFKLIVKLTCGAGFIAVVAPIGLIADASKIGALQFLTAMSTGEATRYTLFDRANAAQWMAGIGLATLPFQLYAGLSPKVVVPQLLVFAGIMGGIAVLIWVPAALTLFRNRILGKLSGLLAGYAAVLTPRRSLVQLAITSVNLALVAATLCVLLSAVGLTPHFWLVVAFVPFLQLINAMPFLYMGWGGRELAMTTTLGAVGGLSTSEALSLSAAFGLTVMISAAVNGLVLLGDWRSGKLVAGAAPEGRPIGDAQHARQAEV
jgi:uncharacterized membrane protein YbhN (UPF0104 family)